MDMKIDRCTPFLICFVVCSLLFSALAYGQEGTVVATCLDDSGNPLKGVKVEILSLDNQKVKDKKSNGDGIAEIDKVAEGVYRVVGRKEDYAPAFYEYLTVGSSQETVTLKLKPGEDSLLYFEDTARIQKAADTLNLAIQAMQANNAAEAEKLLLESVELNPSNVQAMFTLGTYYFQMTRFDQAIETLEKAERMAGMFAALPPVPGQVEPSQLPQLQANARKLIDAVPNYKGELALQQKQYDAAIAIFSGILQKDPNNADTLYSLAIALTYAGRLDEAMNTIDKAIAANPGAKDLADLKQQISVRMENAAIAKAQAALNEGTKLLDSGDAAGALDKFQQAIGLLKEDKQAPVWRQIGKAQAELKETVAAEEAYKKAIDLAPENEITNYINNLAQFYLENNRYGEALETLIDPRALGGKSAEQVLMDLSGKTNDPKFVEAALERVLKINPDNAEAYYVLGRNSYADGKERDSRTKELLTKYLEIGQDPQKIQSAKDILVVVNGRSK